MSASSHKWVRSYVGGSFPANAVEGGHDCDGCTIYVGRALHCGDWCPAKIIPDKDACYISYAGREHFKSDYEVLVEKRYQWIESNNGEILEGAVVGGQTEDGETLYIGRANHEGSLTVGKIHPSHGGMFIPFGGEEHSFFHYETLVYR